MTFNGEVVSDLVIDQVPDLPGASGTVVIAQYFGYTAAGPFGQILFMYDLNAPLSAILYGDSDPSGRWPALLTGDDLIIGRGYGTTGGADHLAGYGGNDTIYGFGDGAVAGGGEDTIEGGDGNDLLVGGGGTGTGSGKDLIFGGAGNDMLYGEDDDDLLVGGTGSDTLFAGAGDDTLHGDEDAASLPSTEADVLAGGAGNDLITGADGNDFIYGDTGWDPDDGGDDTISSGGGDDFIVAGPGADQVTAGAGDDTLYGYTFQADIAVADGDDTLDGGEGSDCAVFTGVIGDYVITRLDASTVTVFDTRGIEGTDTLIDIEFAVFIGGGTVFGIDLSGIAPPV
jgi:Ca2+-binding RTX toxin-like protein